MTKWAKEIVDGIWLLHTDTVARSILGTNKAFTLYPPDPREYEFVEKMLGDFLNTMNKSELYLATDEKKSNG